MHKLLIILMFIYIQMYTYMYMHVYIYTFIFIHYTQKECNIQISLETLGIYGRVDSETISAKKYMCI